MMNEVRFSSYTESGQPNLRVDFETFIRLFVNHRPVYGIGKNNIEDAFKNLMEAEGETGMDGLVKDQLIRELKENGEEMTIQELSEIMGNLVSELDLQAAFPELVTSDKFAEDILGFEEVDENEEEEGDE